MSGMTRAEQAEQTRQAILTTAMGMFTEQGYDATSLQAIADGLGITKANVYYYFHTKAEILEAALTPSMAHIARLLDEAETIRARRARARFLVDGFVDVLVGNRGISMAVVSSADPALRRVKHVGASIDGLRERGLAVLFGADASPDERAAYYCISVLGDFVPAFAELSDDELRATLIRTCDRLLRIRT
jgi:AcrR family transcriptional regulator